MCSMSSRRAGKTLRRCTMRSRSGSPGSTGAVGQRIIADRIRAGPPRGPSDDPRAHARRYRTTCRFRGVSAGSFPPVRRLTTIAVRALTLEIAIDPTHAVQHGVELRPRSRHYSGGNPRGPTEWRSKRARRPSKAGQQDGSASTLHRSLRLRNFPSRSSRGRNDGRLIGPPRVHRPDSQSVSIRPLRPGVDRRGTQNAWRVFAPYPGRNRTDRERLRRLVAKHSRRAGAEGPIRTSRGSCELSCHPSGSRPRRNGVPRLMETRRGPWAVSWSDGGRVRGTNSLSFHQARTLRLCEHLFESWQFA